MRQGVQSHSHGLLAAALVCALTAGAVVGAGVGLAGPAATETMSDTAYVTTTQTRAVDSTPASSSASPSRAPEQQASRSTPPAPQPSATHPTTAAKKAAGPVVDPLWPDNKDGAGCPAPRYSKAVNSGSPANGKRVLVIGDSRTRESRSMLIDRLVDSGWTPTVRCWGWKHIGWGVNQVIRARQLHQLPVWIVVSLSINDMGDDSPAQLRHSIDRMLNEIGKGHRILWLEEYSTRSPATFSGSHVDYPEKVAAFNAYLKERAAEDSRLTVIPWVSVVKKNHLGLFDGIHYGTRGYRYRADTIVDALNRRVRRS